MGKKKKSRERPAAEPAVPGTKMRRREYEAELAKLIEGWRPLRPATVTESGWSA